MTMTDVKAGAQVVKPQKPAGQPGGVVGLRGGPGRRPVHGGEGVQLFLKGLRVRPAR